MKTDSLALMLLTIALAKVPFLEKRTEPFYGMTCLFPKAARRAYTGPAGRQTRALQHASRKP